MNSSNCSNYKRIIAMVLCLCLIFTVIPAGFNYAEAETTASDMQDAFAGGSGTEANPYQIENKYQLELIHNDLDAHYILKSDIVFADEDFAEGGDFYNEGEGWEPIGDYNGYGFGGVLDGDGHKITGLKINSTKQCVGLFETSEGVIKNLGMEGCEISVANGGFYAGAIVGNQYGDGRVESCYNAGSVSGNEAVATGGIVGIGVGYINNCYNAGMIIGGQDAGGIAGNFGGTITNCYNTGSVKGTDDVGGIVGFLGDDVLNCYNVGKVNDGAGNAIAGYITGGNLENCYYFEGSSLGEADITALSRDEMKQKESFEGFDFENVWTIDTESEYNYPHLVGLPIPSVVDISRALIADIPEQTYTGEAITPILSVTYGEKELQENVDYVVSYSNNLKAGTATVTITGIGKYTGVVTKPFTIAKRSLSGFTANLAMDSYTYDGKAKTPAVTVYDSQGIELKLNKDYVVAYSNNIGAGTAKVAITGIKKYTDTITRTFVINPQQYTSKFKVSLSTKRYTYDGKTKKPSVTVYNAAGEKLANGTDYKVSYQSGRKTVGKYKVTVTFKGNYAGSKSLYFTIVPKNTKSVKTTLYGYDDVKISWSKVSDVNGYKIYYKKSGDSEYSLLKTTTKTSYKKKNLSDGVKYYFKVVTYKVSNGEQIESTGKTSEIYTLKKVTSVKAKKSGSQVKISWKNISGETGYQISKSTSKRKTGTITTYKTTKGKSKTISASKGKTYYYKVRAYKTVDGKRIYGPWSSVVKYKR